MAEITDKDRYLIEKHLDKALNSEEQNTFNQRLEDADFAAEVALYAQSVKAIHAFGDDNLKAILKEEEAKLVGNIPPQYKPTKTTAFRQNWAIAAAILLLISVGLWFFNKKTSIYLPSADIVFEQNFKPYKNFDAPNVRDNTTKTNREKAYSLYENGDYKTALIFFEKIDTPSKGILSDQYKDLFFEANAYLATKQADKAASLLEKLSHDPTFELQKQADWYWALSLLSTKPKEAQAIFERIKKDTSHPFYQNAAQIKPLY